MRKSLLFGGIFSIVFAAWLLFFVFGEGGAFYNLLTLVYFILIFLVTSPRSKSRLSYFLFVVDKVRVYFFPAFALITAWLFLLAFNNSLNLSSFVTAWYFLFFVFVDMVIWIPTFSILEKNINSLFARLYFVFGTFVFGWFFSGLSGGIGGTAFGKNLSWLAPFADNGLFYLLSYLELFAGIFLVWYLFKLEYRKF